MSYLRSRQLTCWYWQRLERQQENWSIWDECVIEEIDDLAKEKIPKEKDEQSWMLERVRGLQILLKKAADDGTVNELKDKYNIFGDNISM